MRWIAAIPIALAGSACGSGEIQGDFGSAPDAGIADKCEPSPGSEPPATPEVLSPVAGALDVQADTLRISTSAFADGDGDGHLGTEYELHLLAGDEPVALVWSASVDSDAALTEVTLADGRFSPGFDHLEPWQRYGVRARHLDEECSFSDWSPITPFRTDDGSTFWFSDPGVREIELSIPPASWDAINAEARPPGCVLHERSYYVGEATVAGESFTGVGLRAKGGCGSSRTLDRKAGLKIHLGWDDPAVPGCGETRRSRGVQRFTLNNQVQDASKVHEVLAYALYRDLGIPTPRVAPVRVTVNDEYFGLYLQLETYDRRFLQRWFPHSGGMLYEGVYYCDVVPENVPEDEATASPCFQRKFDTDECSSPDPGDDPTTWEPLRTLAQGLAEIPEGEFYPRAGDYLDWDNFFTLWAIDTIIVHWDGFFGNRNNYRIYHEPTSDRFYFIPHGVDQTFVSGREREPTASLGKRCLAEEDCVAAFAARLAEVNDRFEAMGPELIELAQSHLALIRDHMTASREEHNLDTIEAQVQATIDFVEDRPDEVRAYIETLAP